MAFEGFERRRITTSGCDINLVTGGAGPPLLLLHGYPQTHFMWHKIAPGLAEHFTVVATDLRGYGDSGHPPDGENHAGYCKRANAADQVEVMNELGFDRFMVAGHDRGGRVAHRLALDHPERVEKVSVLDIIPTRWVFATTDQEVATAYYHWFFLIQAAPLPETLIEGNADYCLDWLLRRWGSANGAITDEAFAEYRRCFREPATIHATCEDYRAGASIDLEHDEADIERRVECPLLALWGEKSFVHRRYDVLEVWKNSAAQVRGHAIPCGHFLPEEAPDETLAALLGFLKE